MPPAITLSEISPIDGEPRVLDTALAESLGFERPRAVRQLIDRNRAEIEALGILPRRVAKLKTGRGRPETQWWLNEPQALLVCMFARTEKAAEVRKQIIEVFMAWRRWHSKEKTVAVTRHHRRPPSPALPAQEFRVLQGSGPLATVVARVPWPVAARMLEAWRSGLI